MSEKIFNWMPFDSRNFGKIYRPVAYVEMQSQYGDWKIFYPEVDSGAPISVFNKDDCDVLGYSIRSGRPIYLSGVLGGDEVPAYIHIVDIKIGDETIPAKIAFTDGKKHKQLLGRIDIFENFRICFINKGLQTSFLKE